MSLHGAISKGNHPTVTRSVQRSENCTMEIQIVGDYLGLERVVLTSGVGDDAGNVCTNSEGDSFNGYKIKNLSLSREEGNVGLLSASLVKCGSITKPYHITYTVDMVEDQRTLLRHPMFRGKSKSYDIIRKWNETREGLRFTAGDTPEKDVYRYEDYEGGGLGGSDSIYVDDLIDVGKRKLFVIKDEVALKYCKAVVAGIETYNVYLPVISKVSLYLKQPPGVSQDDDTHEIKGNLEFSKGIGRWDSSFGFTLVGFEDNEKQGWFKSQDQWLQNSDGSWQRTEQWTFSDSKDHAWIYEENNSTNGGKK